MKLNEIDPKVIHLYDDYCHGQITRREFFRRAATITVGGVTALITSAMFIPGRIMGSITIQHHVTMRRLRNSPGRVLLSF